MEVAKVPSAAQRRSRKLERLARIFALHLENAGVESALEGSELDTPGWAVCAGGRSALRLLGASGAARCAQAGEVSGVVDDDQEIPDVSA